MMRTIHYILATVVIALIGFIVSTLLIAFAGVDVRVADLGALPLVILCYAVSRSATKVGGSR